MAFSFRKIAQPLEPWIASLLAIHSAEPEEPLAPRSLLVLATFAILCIIGAKMFLPLLPTILYKIRMLLEAFVYFVFCWDKRWKKPQDPGAIFGPHLSQGLPVQRKTVYFVRHGESAWNDTFNKGPHRSWQRFAIGFVPGLVRAIVMELYLFVSGKMDSWFYDSPLSYLGLAQVEALHGFLSKAHGATPEETAHLAILRADPGAPKSKLVSSGLRRAASTMAGGFRDRLYRRPDETILVIDALQEISRNPDTLALTPAYTQLQASWMETHYKQCKFQDIFDTQTDMTLYSGNKPVNTNGLKRMLDFCEFLYSSSCKEDYVVCGGHSIWFRSFFNQFLPYSVHHASKHQKIVNGGIVTFDLMRAETRGGPKYMIDPKTIRVVYGGFS